MSKAKLTFDHAIKDAKELLEHFDKVNIKPPPPNAEVLKRSGLIMALTAWETYIEDRVGQALEASIAATERNLFTDYVKARFAEDMKRFNNPDSAKTAKLFRDFLGVDVTKSWQWNGYDPDRACRELDELVAKRGDAVHRSKPLPNGTPAKHLVKRDDLTKAIRFLKDLVTATEKALDTRSC